MALQAYSRLGLLGRIVEKCLAFRQVPDGSGVSTLWGWPRLSFVEKALMEKKKVGFASKMHDR
jgi:hypothetical protein